MIHEDNIRKQIGEQIRSRRKELSMTQQELAEQCGVLQTTINKIENGRYSVSVDKLAIIARVLKCSLVIS